MSVDKIREELEKDLNRQSYRGTIFSVETLRKIIRSGENGELDT
jgi:hypothetical protein